MHGLVAINIKSYRLQQTNRPLSIKIDSASYIDIASYTLPSTVSGDSASACAPVSSSNNNFSCSLSSSNGLRFGTTHTH